MKQHAKLETWNIPDQKSWVCRKKNMNLSGCLLGIVSRRLLWVLSDVSSQVLGQKLCEEHQTHNRTGYQVDKARSRHSSWLAVACSLPLLHPQPPEWSAPHCPHIWQEQTFPAYIPDLPHYQMLRWWLVGPWNQLQMAHDTCRYWVFCKRMKCPCTGSQLALHRSLDESIVYLLQLELRVGLFLSYLLIIFWYPVATYTGLILQEVEDMLCGLQILPPQDCCISKPLYSPTNAIRGALSMGLFTEIPQNIFETIKKRHCT